LGEYARGWWVGVKSGELGSLPIVVGLIIIAIVFQTQNSNFLTAGNFVNLIVQAAAFATIGMGIVFVLLLGRSTCRSASSAAWRACSSPC
jgi:D-xylose transport system permease protein